MGKNTIVNPHHRTFLRKPIHWKWVEGSLPETVPGTPERQWSVIEIKPVNSMENIQSFVWTLSKNENSQHHTCFLQLYRGRPLIYDLDRLSQWFAAIHFPWFYSRQYRFRYMLCFLEGGVNFEFLLCDYMVQWRIRKLALVWKQQ